MQLNIHDQVKGDQQPLLDCYWAKCLHSYLQTTSADWKPTVIMHKTNCLHILLQVMIVCIVMDTVILCYHGGQGLMKTFWKEYCQTKGAPGSSD